MKLTTRTDSASTDPTRLGDLATNSYYLALATAGDCVLAMSQRVGACNYALVPGALASVIAVRVVDKAAAKTLNLSLVDTLITSF